MSTLKFSVKLKEEQVVLTDDNGIDRTYSIRELTGKQRAKYNESFDVKIQFNSSGEATATAGDDFKVLSANEFLAMCFYDSENKLVDKDIIESYPATVVESLHIAALKLSGMDKESLEAAKNELEGKDSSGNE